MTGLRVDLRDVQPQRQDATLTDALHRLPAGGALELVSAVDIAVLRPQLSSGNSTSFTWGDSTQSDGAWRVRIVKDGSDGCCGGCGSH